MYDSIGNRKTYGGDFILSRIFSPELTASMSGRVEDFNNGTYHVYFPLSWEGAVTFSAILYHSSEAVSALWRSRHSSSGLIGFQGKFVNPKEEAVTSCGFILQTKEQVSKIAVEIPSNFEFVNVIRCNEQTPVQPKCEVGMSSPLPSGFFYKGIWNPTYCNMDVYKTDEDFTKCLKGKKLFLIGDSTLRQFIMYFTEGIQIVKYFGFYGKGFEDWEKTLLALNDEKEIYVSYKRHGFPLEDWMFYYFKDDQYSSNQIDQQPGGNNTILVITMGQHFRQFPLQLYIRRAINIRRAIERLYLRSPDTKVIIKTENTREYNTPVERSGNFHGYTQYLVLREVFQGINVGFVDAWDMTVSSDAATVHPPGYTFESIMSMTFTFAC
ncbi:hypothetical protein GDO86_018745 [Hymenochirus boettgeri]|uniref:NXPE C-terminal domain-containing protein n=1 Tax=Hymenochirus boettgeri TaxID=247094 RepID=A0A8T2IHH5_9PIPI|nr:hypothetical protein GDO86_018745 [Hymenochirus boettgeri]